MTSYPQIYMPFKSLKGFDEYVKQKEIVPFVKKELMQDQIDELNYAITQIQVGSMIEIIYLDCNQYVKKCGKVSYININLKKLRIVKCEIPLTQVISIKLEE